MTGKYEQQIGRLGPLSQRETVGTDAVERVDRNHVGDARAPTRHIPRWPTVLDAFFRIVVAAGLAIDAYVHADLAGTYAETGGTINEGILFRVETVVASVAALAVLVTGRRLAYLFAFVVAASALALMLVARYVQLAPFGPFPDLSDPVWFPEKLLAAYAEGAAALAALGGFLLHGVRGRASRRSA